MDGQIWSLLTDMTDSWPISILILKKQLNYIRIVSSNTRQQLLQDQSTFVCHLSFAYHYVAQNNRTMTFLGTKVLAKSEQEKPKKFLETFYIYSDTFYTSFCSEINKYPLENADVAR